MGSAMNLQEGSKLSLFGGSLKIELGGEILLAKSELTTNGTFINFSNTGFIADSSRVTIKNAGNAMIKNSSIVLSNNSHLTIDGEGTNVLFKRNNNSTVYALNAVNSTVSVMNKASLTTIKSLCSFRNSTLNLSQGYSGMINENMVSFTDNSKFIMSGANSSINLSRSKIEFDNTKVDIKHAQIQSNGASMLDMINCNTQSNIMEGINISGLGMFNIKSSDLTIKDTSISNTEGIFVKNDSDLKIVTSSYVKIDIFNIKGQKVKALVNEHYQAGRYKAVWSGTEDNGRKVGSGIYFYRVKTEEKTVIKKMVMVK
jgi:hypothetical protein